MTNDTNSPIARKVLERVRAGNVHMRTRAYFIMRIAASLCVAGFALLFSAGVVSFILFSVHESGEQFLLGYGMRGVMTFFALFPWVPLALDAALILLLEWLLRGFKFGYRFSFVSLFMIAAVTSVLAGIVINFFPIHSTLLDRADHDDLPLIGGIYESIRDPHEDRGVYRGTIVSIDADRIVIVHDDRDTDTDDGRSTILINADTAVNAPLSIGSHVYVFGAPQSNGTVDAYGIEPLSQDR